MRQFMTDTVTIINKNGRTEGIRASVQKKKIFIDDVSIPIEAGNTIERTLKNGLTESLEVTDAHLYSGMGGISDFYEIEYERQGSRARRPHHGAVSVTVTDSQQPHINVNSTDQSTSVIYGQEQPIFDEIRGLLQEAVRDASELDQILQSVDDMERNIQTPPEFSRAYREFISVAANHLSILAPQLPSLTNFLQ